VAIVHLFEAAKSANETLDCRIDVFITVGWMRLSFFERQESACDRAVVFKLDEIPLSTSSDHLGFQRLPSPVLDTSTQRPSKHPASLGGPQANTSRVLRLGTRHECKHGGSAAPPEL